MPMTDEERRAYLERAGVTQGQIDETVGTLPIHEETLHERGLSRDAAEKAREVIRRILADATIISAKCCAVARSSEVEVDPDEIESDRRYLDEVFADEYTLFNACGDQLTKGQVTDAMLRGMVQFDGMGSAGFEAVDQSLRVYGDTAVIIGNYELKAKGLATQTDTGEEFEQDLKGLHRITNTYYFRDGRWQAAHSHMTRVPADRPWRFALNPNA